MSGVVTEIGELVSAVYFSSAVQKLSLEEVLAMLRSIRPKNQQLGITGMLLYRDGNFLQVIEGPQTAVRKLISTIERDARHRNIVLLGVKPIAERQFSEWSMAFRDVSKMALEEPGYSPFLEFGFNDELFRAQPALAYKLLLRFKQDMR